LRRQFNSRISNIRRKAKVHFSHLQLKTAVNPPKWEEQAERIVDIHGVRLRKMNECGVEFQVLSLTSPGPQGLSNPEEAQALAARANDYLSQEVKKNPKRFVASFNC